MGIIKPKWLIMLVLTMMMWLGSGIGASYAAETETVEASKTVEDGTRLCVDWWKMSDRKFVLNCRKIGLSNQSRLRSQFAWMLFALVNQPSKDVANKRVWETWPNNHETFGQGSDLPKGVLGRKGDGVMELASGKKIKVKEYRHRNDISYRYIRDRKLYTSEGLKKAIETPNAAAANFPIGAIEVKATWTADKQAGISKNAYSTQKFGKTHYLVGLHIMAKLSRLPDNVNPYASYEQSWFWTTFEFKYKAGSLANRDWVASQKFITYPNAIPQSIQMKLLKQAGLGNSPFKHYVSNGTQTHFTSHKSKPVILGNTTMESYFGCRGTHNNFNPVQWTSWNSSCHTCHAVVGAAIKKNGDVVMTQFSLETSVKTGKLPREFYSIPQPGYKTPVKSLDFVWSFLNVNVAQDSFGLKSTRCK